MPVIAVAAPRFAVRSFQPEKLSAPRFTLPVSVDNGGVLIETDVGAVVAAHAMLAAHDNSLHNVALLNGAAGGCLLDRADHDVTNVCVSLAGAAQHTEAAQSNRR